MTESNQASSVDDFLQFSFSFSFLGAAWKKHGSTQWASHLPFIHPSIQTLSMKQMTAIWQLSDFMASLDEIQAHTAYCLLLSRRRRFIHPQPFPETSVLHHRDPLLDPCHNYRNRDQRWGLPLRHNNIRTSWVFVGISLLRRMEMEETQMGERHHDNDLEISEQVQEKHNVYGFWHRNGKKLNEAEENRGGRSTYGRAICWELMLSPTFENIRKRKRKRKRWMGKIISNQRNMSLNFFFKFFKI